MSTGGGLAWASSSVNRRVHCHETMPWSSLLWLPFNVNESCFKKKQIKRKFVKGNFDLILIYRSNDSKPLGGSPGVIRGSRPPKERVNLTRSNVNSESIK